MSRRPLLLPLRPLGRDSWCRQRLSFFVVSRDLSYRVFTLGDDPSRSTTGHTISVTSLLWRFRFPTDPEKGGSNSSTSHRLNDSRRWTTVRGQRSEDKNYSMIQVSFLSGGHTLLPLTARDSYLGSRRWLSDRFQLFLLSRCSFYNLSV